MQCTEEENTRIIVHTCDNPSSQSHIHIVTHNNQNEGKYIISPIPLAAITQLLDFQNPQTTPRVIHNSSNTSPKLRTSLGSSPPRLRRRPPSPNSDPIASMHGKPAELRYSHIHLVALRQSADTPWRDEFVGGEEDP